jgi:8-hydroxy-5-deazaflavin:NADPH oxidoreductase
MSYAIVGFGAVGQALARNGLPSSAVVAKAFPGAMLVKAFNHLSADVLAEDPAIEGGRRVVFLSGNDQSAIAMAAAPVEQLGYPPVQEGAVIQCTTM